MFRPSSLAVVVLLTATANVATLTTPLNVQAADLVVWWEKGFTVPEDEAIAEVIDAFEHHSGKQVELVHYLQEELPDELVEALEAGEPPDFAFGLWINTYVPKWALDDRLVDLTETIGPFSNLFDSDALDWATLLNAATGQKALYALPVAILTNHVHVWTNLLNQAGFTLADVPREWEAFWSFWCDQVQPGVRQATGRDDVWGVGLAMSPDTADTVDQFLQFVAAYQADYVTRDGRLIIDDPEIRQRLVIAIDSYAEIYRKGCTPPSSLTWDSADNNRQFHSQAVVMTPNFTLSIPNALKSERPDDYTKNTATIEWPLGPTGEAFPIAANVTPAVVFKEGRNVDVAREFVRFLVREGWLAHYFNFSAERMLPAMTKLLEQPFWLDPTDRHRMASVMQLASRPLAHEYAPASGDWRHYQIYNEWVWPQAIHRIVTDGITPDQAVDEAIDRIKQILSE